MIKENVCKWKRSGTIGVFITQCCYISVAYNSNGKVFKRCPYCGRKIKVDE